MQLSPLDASLRDPASRMGDGANVITAGLHRPDVPQLMTQDEIRRLRTRKRMEYELILSLDKTKLDVRKECWYLIDATWLNQWAQFVDIERQDRLQKEREEKAKQKEERRRLRQQRWEEADISDDEGSEGFSSSDEEEDEDEIELFYDPEQDDVEEPGVLSTAELMDGEGKPLPGLTAKIDYRGIPCTSYYCFKELYGKDKSADLPRYVVDIYKPSVAVDRLVPIQMKAQQEAKSLVGAMRPKWMQWELEYYKEEDEEEDQTIMSCCCCGLTKDHLETFIYWGVRCCFWFNRRKDARNNISYRQYNPLRYRDGDSTRGLDSSRGGSTRSSRSSRSSRSVRSSSSQGSKDSRRSRGSSRSRRSRGSRRGSDDGISYADRNNNGVRLRDFFQFRFLRG